MLTPFDKVTKPGGNDIIQVVVTRSCDLFNCSNCTQLLPFRKDPGRMTLACAEEALQSLEGWPGIIAIFGGNPCTHPQFEELCDLWEEYVPINQRGLWTNNLMGKGKRASETFIDGVSRFNFNVHTNGRAAEEMRRFFPKTKVHGEHKQSVHGALLGRYSDYGVNEADWIAARENCDINQKWSAGIYAREEVCQRCGGRGEIFLDGTYQTVGKCPVCLGGKMSKGPQRPYVYFCEVAGAIDGVTGENNGLLAAKDWWKRPIADFNGQVKNCCDKSCVVPLKYTGSIDLQFNYDVSKSVVQLTTDRVGKATVTCHSEPQTKLKELTDYQELRR
jgi:hypothetical protein